ncbi:MAG: hypothetical protein PUF45_01800 [Lachnospiraceae bacterium]|nr:hypothetical protein [Lachnospiraceae bacterium]
MSAKTKIVVLRMKRIIFLALLGVVGILLGILILALIFPKENSAVSESQDAAVSKYIPGVYTSSIMLDGTEVDVQVVVDENNINSVSLVQLDDTIETMYPLITPTIEDLEAQILEKQSFDEITYAENSQYTSIVLLGAIQDAISKASSE